MLLLPAAWGQRSAFEVAAPAAWVQLQTPGSDTGAAAGQIEDGQQYLLTDHQVRIDGRERTSYRHFASKAVNERGVEAAANISISFNPAYQRLTIHGIQLRRGGQVLPRLDAAAVRVLQRETDLEALVLDGRKTASVFLDDVRVGDVVEYSYSLRGSNPIFGGLQFGDFDLQWGVPVARVHARLLWPKGRTLNLLQRNGAAAPEVVETATHREHRWQLDHQPGRRVERDAPVEFDPLPSVHWGEFADWPAVVKWALPLYAPPAHASPKVAALAGRLAREQADPGQRLLAALRFVQGEVRYLGIEIGTSSHAPAPPERVLERRFGDCKDKTLLLIALLKAMDIDAAPALVNTSVRGGIASWQPSPGAFNHVLVHARLGGQDYWLDPTRRPQAGALVQAVQADFGLALVVRPASTGLQAMAGDGALADRREIRTELDSRAGVDKPASYTVTTIATGVAAESLRNTLATSSRDRLQQDYTNFYAQYYEGLRMAAPLDVADDKASNRITITEHYTIEKPWSRATQQQRSEIWVQAPELVNHLRQPKSQIRQSPLALAPTELLHVTTVRLPQPWGTVPGEVAVTDAAFELRRTEAWNEDRTELVLTDRFKTLVRQVGAADVPAYAANLEKARSSLSYQLYLYDNGGAFSPHWLPAVLGCLGVVGFGVLVWRLHRWNPPPAAPVAPSAPIGPVGPLGWETHAPQGLGGWLILVGFGLLFGIWQRGRTLWEGMSAFNTAYWLEAVLPGSPQWDAWLMPSLLFSLLANVAMLMLNLLVVVLFVRRRSSFTRLYMALLVANLATVAAEMVLMGLSTQLAPSVDGFGLARTAFWSVIWVLYTLRSVRVRLTFVEHHRLGDRPRPSAAAAASASV